MVFEDQENIKLLIIYCQLQIFPRSSLLKVLVLFSMLELGFSDQLAMGLG